MHEDAIEFAHELFEAARGGQREFVIAAIDQGVPINLADAKGNTMLMLAAYHGQVEMVRALLQRHADVDATNDRGQTPLAGAVFKKDHAVMQALIEGGADIDAGTPSARETGRMFDVPLPSAEGGAS